MYTFNRSRCSTGSNHILSIIEDIALEATLIFE